MVVPARHPFRRRAGALTLGLSLGVGGLLALSPAAMAATTAGVEQNRAAKTITLTGGDLRLVFAYDKQATVSSLKLKGTELVQAGMSSTAHTSDGAAVDSRKLSADPAVKVSGKTVTVTFPMTDGALNITETWKFTTDRTGVDLDVRRTYGSATTIDHNGQLRIGWARVWDNIRRPADGGNLPIGNAYTGRNNFFLSQPNDRYGVEQDDFVLLANAQKAALSVAANGNHSTATEFAYLDDGNTYQETQVSSAPQWQYQAGTAASGLVYGGHSSNGTSAYIYAPVAVTAGQQDDVHYRFSPADYAAEYDLGGKINGVQDTAALTSLLNDFGRSGMVDKGYGMSTVGTRYPGVGPYDMVYADRTVLGYGEGEMTDSQKKVLEFFRDSGQLDTGHMRGRTFHLDYPWRDDTLADADPAYALSVADMYANDPDAAWLKGMRESVQKSLGFMLSQRHDAKTGLFTNDATSCTSNKGAKEWNDAFFVRYGSGYVNELMYGALTRWAQLEKDVFKDPATATTYRQAAAQLKTQFNKPTTEGGLWDAGTNMFAYWSCPDGTAQVAVQHTQINLQAIYFGLTDLDRSKQILDGVDAQMQRTHLPLIPMNFWPITSADEWSGDHFQSGLEDGAIYPFMTEEYARAAAVVGERERSLKYVNNALKLYTRDGYNGYSYVTWTQHPKAQEAWFPSNANAGTGLYLDILGINATPEGVTVAPNIPKSMVGTSVTHGVHGDEKISVSYLSQLKQVVNYQAKGRTVTVAWPGQKPGKAFTVTNNGRSSRATADDLGTVRITFAADGKHTVELNGGAANGYELPSQPDNLAYGAKVTSTSSLENSNWGATKLVDGNPFSGDDDWGWSSNSDLTESHTESVTIDLGSSKKVSKAVLDPRAYDGKDVGMGYPEDFTIETSTDGQTWKTAVDKTAFAQPTGRQQPAFELTGKARYVRVTGTKLRQAKDNLTDEIGYQMQFAEIEVY
jgi:hypothetical protein